MTDLPGKSRRVLIASSHPLFAKGLTNLLQKRQEEDVTVLGVVSSLEDAFSAIQMLQPDLVIVDYDDEAVNREEFLAHFMEGAGKLRVVLLSLKEGGDQAVVYDRRNLAAAQIDEWLNEWTETPQEESGKRPSHGATQSRREVMKHWIGVILLVILLAVAVSFVLQNDNLLTQAASLQAGPIDQAFSVLWITIAVLFALIVGFLLYSVIFFRRKKGDETDGPHMEGNNALEVTWTIIPLITVIGFAVYGSINLSEVLRPDPQAMEVRVIGQQWAWRFEYPEFGVTSSELVLPINQQVLLNMESADVLHSFWVPEFRVKQDLLPNRRTQLRITPNQIGDFKVACAEICGQSHAYMLADVRVVGGTEFEQWIFAQSDLPEDPVERGAIWSEQFGCIACHSQDGTVVVGPSWQGIYGSERLLADGSTVLADDAYLIESILDPNVKIVTGFQPNIMPQNFNEVLSETQINDIIAFIESLQ
jgi:cytochrome c oxidase subunit II